MKPLFIGLLFALAAFGQTVTPTKSCPSFYAAGAEVGPSHKVGGDFAVATPFTKCGPTLQMYSFTMTGVTPNVDGTKVSFGTTATSGVAVPLPAQYNPFAKYFDVFAFINAGSTTLPASGTKLSVPWGGVMVFHLGKSWVLLPGAKRLDGKTSGWVGLGRNF